MLDICESHVSITAALLCYTRLTDILPFFVRHRRIRICRTNFFLNITRTAIRRQYHNTLQRRLKPFICSPTIPGGMNGMRLIGKCYYAVRIISWLCQDDDLISPRISSENYSVQGAHGSSIASIQLLFRMGCSSEHIFHVQTSRMDKDIL